MTTVVIEKKKYTYEDYVYLDDENVVQPDILFYFFFSSFPFLF